ncbi:hypothetical protein EDB84DRAFT_488824 [Lactarius hengduanensis]|nr:hypothetical protein EDB84DRAFT_488824 [Lactarius hengduanensis]
MSPTGTAGIRQTPQTRCQPDPAGWVVSRTLFLFFCSMRQGTPPHTPHREHFCVPFKQIAQETHPIVPVATVWPALSAVAALCPLTPASRAGTSVLVVSRRWFALGTVNGRPCPTPAPEAPATFLSKYQSQQAHVATGAAPKMAYVSSHFTTSRATLGSAITKRQIYVAHIILFFFSYSTVLKYGIWQSIVPVGANGCNCPVSHASGFRLELPGSLNRPASVSRTTTPLM